jgi:hypothetical protein
MSTHTMTTLNQTNKARRKRSIHARATAFSLDFETTGPAELVNLYRVSAEEDVLVSGLVSDI